MQNMSFKRIERKMLKNNHPPYEYQQFSNLKRHIVKCGHLFKNSFVVFFMSFARARPAEFAREHVANTILKIDQDTSINLI